MIRYCRRETLVHKLSPTTKLALVLGILLVSILFVDLRLQLFLFLLVLFLILLARLPWNEVLGFAGLFLMLAFPVALLQGFVYPLKDYVVFEIFGLKAYHSGLLFGLAIALRLLTIGLATPLVLMTTRVGELAESLRRYLPDYLVFGLVLAFRFIPLFEESIRKIRMAQEARGAKKDFHYLILLLVPLFARALKRSTVLARSLESKGFRVS